MPCAQKSCSHYVKILLQWKNVSLEQVGEAWEPSRFVMVEDFLWKQIFLKGRGLGYAEPYFFLISFPTVNRLQNGGRGRDSTKATKVRRFLRCHTRLETKFWRQHVWAACFVKPATHVTINEAINPLVDNYLRRLSVLCTHSHQQHVFLGRNTCGFGPSYTRKKSHAMCGTRPGVYSESNIHTYIYWRSLNSRRKIWNNY